MTSTRRKRRGADRGLFERPVGSGVWWIRYHDENGREHREKIGPKSLARRVYQKRKTEITERRFFPESIRKRETLLADAIRDHLARNASRLRAFGDWERIGGYWIDAPETRGRTLPQVTTADVERYRERRRKDGIAEATCNRELGFLRTVYRRAVEAGLVDRSPVVSRLFYPERNERIRYLTDEEETRLREAVGDEHWPKIVVALHTGMRRANVFGLRWEDVDFDAGVITAKRTKSGVSYHVPINDALRAVLRALPSRLRSAWVFPSETGETPLDGKNFVRRVLEPALVEAKIPGFRFHDLRHTFASRLAMNGENMRTVQELLGHQSLRMTERYAHLSPAHMLAAVRRLDERRSEDATGTTTGTDAENAPLAVGDDGVIREINREERRGGRCVARTRDPRLVRPMLFQLS